jgi:hypothetical protein
VRSGLFLLGGSMKETYFVISPNEGDVMIHPMSQEELIKKLEEEWWGSSVTFINSSNKRMSDLNDWNHTDIMIIKGSVVVPQPKEVVKTYVIE